MRKIDIEQISSAVRDAVIDINHRLPASFVKRLEMAKASETGQRAKSVLKDLVDNQRIASEGIYPLCQDTGVVVVFADIGHNVFIDGDFEAAVNAGVREATLKGHLRPSVVNHPFNRVNTKDNTPAIIHQKRIAGDTLKLRIAAKGAGSENMSALKMLKPSDGLEGVKTFVVETVRSAGGRPCPPITLGIGIGGTMEKCALLAKEALFKALDEPHPDERLARFEEELLEAVNDLSIGPMGIGGKTTCLAVKINDFPMHMAALPVAVNIQCHASRHTEVVL